MGERKIMMKMIASTAAMLVLCVTLVAVSADSADHVVYEEMKVHGAAPATITEDTTPSTELEVEDTSSSAETERGTNTVSHSCRRASKWQFTCFDARSYTVRGKVVISSKYAKAVARCTNGNSWDYAGFHKSSTPCAPLSCRNSNGYGLTCIDSKFYIKHGHVKRNGGENLSSLSKCHTWTGEGGGWKRDYRNSCVKSCVNPVTRYSLHCIDRKSYTYRNGAKKTHSYPQSSLDRCTAWTGEGGKWQQSQYDCNHHRAKVLAKIRHAKAAERARKVIERNVKEVAKKVKACHRSAAGKRLMHYKARHSYKGSAKLSAKALAALRNLKRSCNAQVGKGRKAARGANGKHKEALKGRAQALERLSKLEKKCDGTLRKLGGAAKHAHRHHKKHRRAAAVAKILARRTRRHANKVCRIQRRLKRKAKAMERKSKNAKNPTFNWSAAVAKPCKPGKGKPFKQPVKHRKRLVVGVIPKGVSDVFIDLNSKKDVDLELWHAAKKIAVVAWSKGKLDSAGKSKIKYEGTNIGYSGWNGVKGKSGHEWIRITGTTTVPFVMKVYGFQAGHARVTYKWGKNKAKCNKERSAKAKVKKERKAKYNKLLRNKKLKEKDAKKFAKLAASKATNCKSAKSVARKAGKAVASAEAGAIKAGQNKRKALGAVRKAGIMCGRMKAISRGHANTAENQAKSAAKKRHAAHQALNKTRGKCFKAVSTARKIFYSRKATTNAAGSAMVKSHRAVHHQQRYCIHLRNRRIRL